METINWNAFGEGDYDTIDYITVDGFSLDVNMIRSLSFSEGHIGLTVKVKHGVNTFLSLLRKICSNGQILTARASNYHGGYLLASAVVSLKSDAADVFIVPDTLIVNFEAKDFRLDTYSNFDEHNYLIEIKQKDL